MAAACTCPFCLGNMLQCEYCRSPPLFWENWRTPGRYEFLAQALSTAAPRYRRRIIVEKWAKPRIIFLDFGPQPSICVALFPPLSSPCSSPALCMGGEAWAGCQSACGGVNGQPSARNTLWMSHTARSTNERLQARLVRLTAEHRLCVLLNSNVTWMSSCSLCAVVNAMHRPATGYSSVTIFCCFPS